MNGIVTALSKSPTHTMSKVNHQSLNLLVGLGVEGDAHMGKTVKHRSRVAKDPSQPNLRQVHLIATELHEELATKGFSIVPGQMGENITTQGLDLLAFPKGSLLKIGTTALIEVTGLRNPCHQLNGIQAGLMQAVIAKDKDNQLILRAGIMGIILQAGIIKIGDTIDVKYPTGPFIPLARV